MNKTAAENIAQEYYLLGQQAALEKRAGVMKGTAKLYGGLVGATLPLHLAMASGIGKGAPRVLSRLPSRGIVDTLGNASNQELIELGLATPAVLASALGGSKLTGKGIDKLQELLAKSSK